MREGIHVSYCARTVTGDEFEDFIRKLPRPVVYEHATTASEQQPQEQTQHTPRARGTAVDVSDLETLGKWVEDTAEEFGGIDYVVANGMPDPFQSGQYSFPPHLTPFLTHSSPCTLTPCGAAT